MSCGLELIDACERIKRIILCSKIIKNHLPPECHLEIFILNSQMAPLLSMNTTSEATI